MIEAFVAPRCCHTQVCYLFVCLIGCYCSPEVWACWLVSSPARQAEEAQLSHSVSARPSFPKDSLQKKMHHVRTGQKTSRFYSSCKSSTKSDRCWIRTGTIFLFLFFFKVSNSSLPPQTWRVVLIIRNQDITALHSQHANNALWIVLFRTIISAGKESSCL